MAVQMTFRKYGLEYKAAHNGASYLIARRGGAYIAMVQGISAPRATALPGGWLFENRGQAEEACNVHATKTQPK